jgi:hypothetical protein
MPEEPDFSPEDIEILDEVWRKRIATKKRERQEKQINTIAERIVEALHARPDGMPWPEIRALFDDKHSDVQIEQALQTLMHTSLARNKVEKTAAHSGERFLLAAS